MDTYLREEKSLNDLLKARDELVAKKRRIIVDYKRAFKHLAKNPRTNYYNIIKDRAREELKPLARNIKELEKQIANFPKWARTKKVGKFAAGAALGSAAAYGFYKAGTAGKGKIEKWSKDRSKRIKAEKSRTKESLETREGLENLILEQVQDAKMEPFQGLQLLRHVENKYTKGEDE